MKTKWQEIWEKRSEMSILTSGNQQKVFLELKRLNGYDSAGIELEYQEFYDWYKAVKNELEFSPTDKTHEIKSVFEVGCGSGANLYLFQNDGICGGGIDYSNALIDAAKKVLINPRELICDEAINVPVKEKYDAVMSSGVFGYFNNYEYAEKVLEAMYEKAEYSIGIMNIQDAAKKDAYNEYRKRIIKDYEKRYVEEGLTRFFYEKSFFLNFAEKHDMSIRFTKGEWKKYWNREYFFDCYMIK
jgi:SAM-dependent methyltransferase